VADPGKTGVSDVTVLETELRQCVRDSNATVLRHGKIFESTPGAVAPAAPGLGPPLQQGDIIHSRRKEEKEAGKVRVV
jgi:hypothetical protein